MEGPSQGRTYHSLGTWPKAKHVPFSRGGNQGTVMSRN